ncbi:MAG TPA: hypothetical protein VMD09_06610 [Solirubrobacteraceae bacterium]|nr:hypothetical protein [Solirubrobacteraceae bacterium]
MGLRRLKALLILVLPGLALAGCGGGGGSGSLSLSQLPLIPGATIVTQTRQCDSGSHAFCAIQAVIVDPHAHSSGGFVEREHEHLHALGWTTSAGDDGDEVAADSPGHKVRVTYATGLDDMIGLDEKWIKRPWPIWASLSQTLFSRTPAMSILLEAGPT